MYKKILVALENSPTDEAILKHIEPLAKIHASSLLLVHVADGWAARYFDQLSLAESEEMRTDREYLDTVCSRMHANGIQADSLLLLGDPADQIIRISFEDPTIELIAMSTHGHRFLSDLIYGSTATRVRHLVEVPVLLLRAPRQIKNG